ncbi:MAG TPA: hypothetical protein VIL37_06700, partial [Natronosporangium sp.]
MSSPTMAPDVDSDSSANPNPDGFTTDVVIVGGCGRVGLPLGLALASRGLSVVLYDLNLEAVEAVNAGRMP